jgi:high-affinity iron transporter
VFPTWETLVAQVAAFVFVIGSYFLAQEVKVKRPQRKSRKRPATGEEPAAEQPERASAPV